MRLLHVGVAMISVAAATAGEAFPPFEGRAAVEELASWRQYRDDEPFYVCFAHAIR